MIKSDATAEVGNVRGELADYVPAHWKVRLDLDDEPRREQVSLTLSSELLRRLRTKSEKQDKSLSRYIDELLQEQVPNDESKIAEAFEEYLVESERLLIATRLPTDGAPAAREAKKNA